MAAHGQVRHRAHGRGPDRGGAGVGGGGEPARAGGERTCGGGDVMRSLQWDQRLKQRRRPLARHPGNPHLGIFQPLAASGRWLRVRPSSERAGQALRRPARQARRGDRGLGAERDDWFGHRSGRWRLHMVDAFNGERTVRASFSAYRVKPPRSPIGTRSATDLRVLLTHFAHASGKKVKTTAKNRTAATAAPTFNPIHTFAVVAHPLGRLLAARQVHTEAQPK